MASTIKNVATQVATKSFAPSRTFFRVSEQVDNISQARAVIKTLGHYGDMIEYKFMRCPETLKYLRYGFVVYRNRDDANKAIADQFIKVQSELFDKPVDVKLEKSVNNNAFKNNRRVENINKKNNYHRE